MDIVAFDVDGVLTKEQGLEKFKEAHEYADLVGIVSARSHDHIIELTVDEKLDPDFVRSAQLKGKALRKLSRKFDADEKMYVGSWFRDRMHAKTANWNYQEM